MRRSKVLAKIRSGQVARICCLCGPLSFFPRLAAHFDYDGVWVDGEHRAWNTREIETAIAHHHLADVDCIWRSPALEKTALYRLLEDGATGLMIPMVNTAAMAAQLVRAMKFPPLGERSLDGAGLDSGFWVGKPDDYPAQANRETFLVAQIETPEALENVDAIAAVPGVDVLMIGPGDLSLRLGCDGGVSDPKMLAAQQRVAAAARRHGRAWGRPVGNADSARVIIEQGARFVVFGSDFWGIHDQLASCSRELAELTGEMARNTRPAVAGTP